MLARSLLPAVPLLLGCMPCAFGQLPTRLEKCLPYPTLAQEIHEMQPTPTEVRVRVHVVRVNFDLGEHIPADAQDEISAELRSRVFGRNAQDAYLNDLANEIAEVSVRGTLRDRGYFKAAATARLTQLRNEGEDISVAVAIRAAPGPRYRTGDIRIESTDSANPLAISPEILLNLIPLHRGEVFRTGRVRAGMENLERAFWKEGYVDMTPEPDTEVNDVRRIIDLVIKIDQQVQYRVGSVEFLGVNSVTKGKLMESLPKPGDVFDRRRLEEFLKVNRTILPADASIDDVRVERHNKLRTVGILFDFRVCPQNSN